jgi:hypothetical protein
VLRILAREDAAAADGLEREAEAADAGEELDEVEAHVAQERARCEGGRRGRKFEV